MEEPLEYRGPFVVLQPDPIGYRVSVEPPLNGGADLVRTYREKHDAWGYARDLWTENRLPLLDLTDGNTGRDVHPGPSKIPVRIEPEASKLFDVRGDTR